MVRTIVGTAVEVGRGQRATDGIQTTLEGRDRRRAGQTAPPQGLVLARVEHAAGPVDRPSAD
jgi:tRNA pseudouridine38-40 synthase